MLDVRRMRVLREVAVQGTIAGAAAALDFTPSAVSQQLAALEREAGVALVDRGPSSVVLTEAGRTLVDHAEVVLAQLAQAEADLRSIGGLRSGRLCVGSFSSVAELTSRALHSFHMRYPDVELTVTESDAQDSLARTQRGELDVALVYIYDYAPLDGIQALEIRELMRDPVAVAVPGTHPLAGRSSVSLTELTGERWIVESPGSVCERLVRGACRKAGFEPKVQLACTTDYRISQALVAAKIGVAFIPRLAQQPHPGVAYLTPEDPVGRTIAVAYRAGGRRSRAVTTMIDIIQETAARADPGHPQTRR
jgi:DNA-binding transcriptional LysR family regulator